VSQSDAISNPAVEPHPARAVVAPGVPTRLPWVGALMGTAVTGTMALVAFGSFSSPCCVIDSTPLHLSKVAERVEIHALRTGTFPTNQDGLAAVFGDEVPSDPWGHQILYVAPGPDGRRFDLISFGEDGRVGGTGADADLRYSEVR
jgi:hypothetical protein